MQPADSTWDRVAVRSGMICGAILLLHTLLLIWFAASNSATFDEPAHLAAGCEYWKHGDFTIYSLSPPLLRLWGAIPAVLAGANAVDPTPFRSLQLTNRHWYYALTFVADNGPRFQTLLFFSRIGMIPLSCAAGLICFLWARQIYGPIAALAACALYCFNPSILANASLVTTDVGTVTALLASAWLWWKFCRASVTGTSKKIRWVIWSFLCAAVLAAHLCKFTAVILWPMMLLMAVPFLWNIPWRNRASLLAAYAGALLFTVIGINAAYGFHGTFARLDSFAFTSRTLQSARARFPGLRSPLPRIYLEGFDAQKADTQNGYPSYLFGRTYIGTVWYYYPVALLCKLPLGAIVLLIAGIISFVRAKTTRENRRDELAVILPGLTYLAGVVLLSDVNIGTRYLLPVFPFAMILTARLWRGAKSFADGRAAKARNILLAAAVLEAIVVCPRFLTFVNYGVGGPSNGWRLLSDSDFDWGQGLIDLRNWMNSNGVKHIQLCYFGFIEPEVYGIAYTPFNGNMDVPDADDREFIVISSYFMDGLEKYIPPKIGKISGGLGYLDFHESLSKRTPVAVIGNTIFVYTAQDIAAARIQTWAQQPH